MSKIAQVHSGDRITLYREVELTVIPSGDKMTVPKGTTGFVTQTLGGSITLQLPGHGILARLSEQDIDALSPEGTAAKQETGTRAAADLTAKVDEKAVWDVLKTCYDPEIPLNIVDLGLIYDMKIAPLPEGGHEVLVKMTLTAQGCGMGASIGADAEAKLVRLPGVARARVEIVWDPPWNMSMISAEGKKLLGIEE